MDGWTPEEGRRKMEEQERTANIAYYIIQLLGGSLALRQTIDMTALTGINNGTKFTFSGCRDANEVQITMKENGLYDVYFRQFSLMTHKIYLVKMFEDVDSEHLRECFENFTGLSLEPAKVAPEQINRPKPPPPSATLKPRVKTEPTSLF